MIDYSDISIFISVEVKRNSITASQNPLSPSSTGSCPSLPSERLVDGSSDGCSITSTDGVASSDQPDIDKCLSPSPIATQSTSNESNSDAPDFSNVCDEDSYSVMMYVCTHIF